jgi:hypothetical protein
MKNPHQQQLDSWRQQQQTQAWQRQAEIQRAQMAQQQAQVRQQQANWRKQQQDMAAASLAKSDRRQTTRPAQPSTIQPLSYELPQERLSGGKCRYCGYAPVGQSAMFCPNCNGTYPNPSRAVKWGNRLLAGLVMGFFVVLGIILLGILVAVLG